MHRLVVFAMMAIVALAVGQSQAPRTEALFHFSVIDEVVTSYGFDSDVQFVEIRMLAGSQNFVQNSVLGAFDASGTYQGDVVVVPSNVTNSGIGVRWIMGTTEFQTVSGVTPDFIMPASLPTGGGMVCWGAPGVSVPAPGSWDHTNPENYVDCLAYGSYSGPTNSHVGTPNPIPADGRSLVRGSETNNNAADFSCGDPASPTNNGGSSASLAATAGCVTVRIGNSYFCDPAGPLPCTQPNDTPLDPGETVIWEWGPGGAGPTLPHTTTHCPDDDFVFCSGARDWDSTPSRTSGTFVQTFGFADEDSTLFYRCQIHPLSMRGTITVSFSGDNDGDGLSNAQEASLGTDPDVSDTDGDGLDDDVEVNVEGTDPLVADTDSDGFEDGLEVLMGTLPLAGCASTTTANDEDPDAWPPDFDDNRIINIIDVLALKPVFNSPSARHDLNGSGGNVNIIDVLALKPVFNTSCTP